MYPGNGFVEFGTGRIMFHGIYYTVFFHEGAQKYKAKIDFTPTKTGWTSEYDSYYTLCDIIDDIIDIYVHVLKE